MPIIKKQPSINPALVSGEVYKVLRSYREDVPSGYFVGLQGDEINDVRGVQWIGVDAHWYPDQLKAIDYCVAALEDIGQ